MNLQFHSAKERSKNHDIWVQVLFGSGFGSGSSHCLLSALVQFLAKSGNWFGLFLLGSCSFPSRVKTETQERVASTVLAMLTVTSELSAVCQGLQSHLRSNVWKQPGSSSFMVLTFVKFLITETFANKTLSSCQRSCHTYWIPAVIDDGERVS